MRGRTRDTRSPCLRATVHSSFYRRMFLQHYCVENVPRLITLRPGFHQHPRASYAAPQLPRKFTASANVYLRFPRSHKCLARGIRRWTRLIEHERNIRKARYFPSVGIYGRTHPRLRRQQNSNEFRDGQIIPNLRASIFILVTSHIQNLTSHI